MITPTKTVCYAKWAGSDAWHKVHECDNSGVRIDSGWWSYGNFDRFIVREEVCFNGELWAKAYHQKVVMDLKERVLLNWTDEQLVGWFRLGLMEFCSHEPN